MLIRLAEGEGLNKTWVPLAAISPHVPKAVIALEDNTFCEHAGFDWAEVRRGLADGELVVISGFGDGAYAAHSVVVQAGVVLPHVVVGGVAELPL